jgi:DnaD/phage-associated family protein
MPGLKINVTVPDFTLVDNFFIDNYMPKANGDYVKVYLYCLKCGYSGYETSIEDIASALNLLQTDVVNAIKYWKDNGLLISKPDETITIIMNSTKADKLLSLDNTKKEMFEHIQKLLGRPISSKELITYLDFIDQFKFTPEIILLLVEYCVSKNKGDIRYIEKVAMGWHDAGIKTLDEAQKYITSHEDKWSKYRSILNFMGMKDADISKPQEELLNKWMSVYNFSVDIIEEACRICVMRINEPNFSYMDAILSDWSKNNVKTINDVKKLNKKPRASKKAGSYSNNQDQYDMLELKRQLLGRGDNNEQ